MIKTTEDLARKLGVNFDATSPTLNVTMLDDGPYVSVASLISLLIHDAAQRPGQLGRVVETVAGNIAITVWGLLSQLPEYREDTND